MDWINHLDSVWSFEINCKCVMAIRLEPVGLFGQVEIVRRFRRDRVWISSRALKPRSCVNFAEIVSISLLGSDLKNFTEVENVERGHKQEIEFFKLYDRTLVDRPVDRCCMRKRNQLGRSNARSTDISSKSCNDRGHWVVDRVVDRAFGRLTGQLTAPEPDLELFWEVLLLSINRGCNPFLGLSIFRVNS